MRERQSSKPNFSPGDIVLTKQDEMDIEKIPAGTEIILREALVVGIWSGVATLNDVPRNITVFASNLRHK